MTPIAKIAVGLPGRTPVQQKLSIRYRHGTGLVQAALWLILALIATLLSIWFRISTALSEIVVGTVAQLIIGALIAPKCWERSRPGRFSGWNGSHRAYVSGWGELDPGIIPDQVERGYGRWPWSAFLRPFLGAQPWRISCCGVRLRQAGWPDRPIHYLRCGRCMRSMLELGLKPDRFRQRQFSRACFRKRPGTVIALDSSFPVQRCGH